MRRRGPRQGYTRRGFLAPTDRECALDSPRRGAVVRISTPGTVRPFNIRVKPRFVLCGQRLTARAAATQDNRGRPLRRVSDDTFAVIGLRDFLDHLGSAELCLDATCLFSRVVD